MTTERIELLLNTLTHFRKEVRHTAALELKALKHKPKDKVQQAILFLVLEEWGNAVRLGFAALIAALRRLDIETSQDFGKASGLGVQIPALVFRKDKHLSYDFKAYKVDGQIIEIAVKLIHPDKSVRLSAVRQLGQTENANAIASLTSVLSGHDIDMIREAIKALGQIRDQKAVDVLVNVLITKEHYVAIGREYTGWNNFRLSNQRREEVDIALEQYDLEPIVLHALSQLGAELVTNHCCPK